MKRTFRWMAVASLASFAALSLAQQSVGYGAHTELGADEYDESWTGETAGDALEHTSDQAGYGLASAFASGGFGVNRAAVRLRGTDPNNPVTMGVAYAGSSYFDGFTISDPELDGTLGWFTTTLFVHGAGGASVGDGLLNANHASFEASWNAEITVQADGVGVTQNAFYAGGWLKPFDFAEFEYTGDALNAYQTETDFAFVYGQPIYLETRLAAFAQVQNEDGEPIDFDADLDLGHSAYWGGIRNLRDADGNAIGAFGYSSLSGYDYRANAVPEPASMLALAAGGAALLRRRKRA